MKGNFESKQPLRRFLAYINNFMSTPNDNTPQQEG